LEIFYGNLEIRLVIIDSLAFPFRYRMVDDSTSSESYHGLYRIGQKLHTLAAEFDLVVVVTNHVTTQFSHDKATSALVPSLGDSWSHVPNVRIKLAQNFPAGQITTRNLQVVKTCNVMCHSKEDNAVDSANFCITSGGIRDAVP